LAHKDLGKNNHVVSTKEISEILGVTTRRIQQLAQDNALVRFSHGNYDLPASIQKYITYMTEAGSLADGELDKAQEEAKWTQARRKKTELELQIMKGELHRSEDVQLVMSDMLGNFRARLLALPSKIAPQLLGKTDIIPVKDLLKSAVYEALNELSDYDPNAFYQYSKDNLLVDEEEDEDHMDNENEKVNKGPKKNGQKKKEY
jgi:phage terminase Nu1 subunit (DNA packaging protein)